MMSVSPSRPHRRHALAASGAALASGWFPRVAPTFAADANRKRSLILLWMSGGPSTIDLFDLKPGHVNGGPFREIATALPGLRIGEHLPLLAKRAKNLSVVRSMTTKEGDHTRATHLGRTGVPPAPMAYPTVAASIAKERTEPRAELPAYVSIATSQGDGTLSSGFLGPRYAPLAFGRDATGSIDEILRVPNLRPGSGDRATKSALLDALNADFAEQRPGTVTESFRTATAGAKRLSAGPSSTAFDLAKEPEKVRDRYGRTLFGQACLLARRLVERGVACVEVTLPGWDTHGNNFDAVRGLCGTLDRAWASLLEDLEETGLLDTTAVVWMGEFGRTPKINKGNGRDHWPNAWSAVVAGGGFRCGQVVGRTSADGTAVEERPVSFPDLLATICKAVGVDPAKQNDTPLGRPIRIVDKSSKPIEELL